MAASPECLLMLHYDPSYGPRAVAHYHRTQCPDQNGHWAYEGQHFWLRGIHRPLLLTEMEMHYRYHYRRNKFQNFLQNLALDAHDSLHRKSTLAFIRHCSRVGGGGMGNDKLAFDKGGNLPEKVENHCSRGTGPAPHIEMLE